MKDKNTSQSGKPSTDLHAWWPLSVNFHMALCRTGSTSCLERSQPGTSPCPRHQWASCWGSHTQVCTAVPPCAPWPASLARGGTTFSRTSTCICKKTHIWKVQPINCYNLRKSEKCPCLSILDKQESPPTYKTDLILTAPMFSSWSAAAHLYRTAKHFPMDLTRFVWESLTSRPRLTLYDESLLLAVNARALNTIEEERGATPAHLCHVSCKRK